jgi:hypothetical protein
MLDHDFSEEVQNLSPRQLQYVRRFLHRNRGYISRLQRLADEPSLPVPYSDHPVDQTLLHKSHVDLTSVLHGGSILSAASKNASTGVSTAYNGVVRTGERLDAFTDGCKKIIIQRN